MINKKQVYILLKFRNRLVTKKIKKHFYLCTFMIFLPTFPMRYLRNNRPYLGILQNCTLNKMKNDKKIVKTYSFHCMRRLTDISTYKVTKHEQFLYMNNLLK